VAVKGLARVTANLARYEARVLDAGEIGMAAMMERLADWMRAEHSWQNRRPHTESTIEGFVESVTPTHITGRVQADIDAAMWLELARGGKWSWMWPVIVEHQDEMLAMLSAAMVYHLTLVRNPAVMEEYEAAKVSVRTDREERVRVGRMGRGRI
jgi:hypothetical protein